ncbi:hypothetical protein P3X46_024965 [Hevea brasiliensis]|uniref:F-box domain-containing protein n=1 Tax=Hevea brasiliensis TaxID=3981 RepID=A0ABQ9L474_HEVBR|nr:hypothetical protein P3X46_024965 [Hevea brasiliensis]
MFSTSESKLCIQRKKKGVTISVKMHSLCNYLDASRKNLVGLFDFQPIKKLSLGKDCISELPDDILLTILTQLKLREPARTSVLSKRWRFLWTSSQGILEFHGSDFRSIDNSAYDFLRSHRAPTVDELRNRFPKVGHWFYDGQNHHSWINVATGKRVKRPVLDFRNSHPSQELQSLGFSSSFIYLVSLHLIYVRVSSQLIHYFLSNCPLLEVLCVTGTGHTLDHLMICGPSLKLKHLDLRHIKIQVLEISAPNLESFRTTMSFYDVPHLNQVSFGGCYCDALLALNLLDLSSFITQLTSLELVLPTEKWFITNFSNLPRFPTMEILKHLLLSLSEETDESFLIYFCLMEASPSLQRSSLKLGWSVYGDTKLEFTRSPEFTWRPKHQCLKVVGIVGYREYANHDKLVMHLAEYATSLEKIIIDPRSYQCSEVSRTMLRGCNPGYPHRWNWRYFNLLVFAFEPLPTCKPGVFNFYRRGCFLFYVPCLLFLIKINDESETKTLSRSINQ